MALSRRRRWHPTPVLLPREFHGRGSLVGCSPWGCWGLDTTEWLHFHALEKEMVTHSSILAWGIPGTEEPGGLPSMGSHRVGHGWRDLAAAAWLCHVQLNLSAPQIWIADHLEIKMLSANSIKYCHKFNLYEVFVSIPSRCSEQHVNRGTY